MNALLPTESRACPASGPYFRDVGRTAILKPNEEHALCQRVRGGDAEARDHLVRANLRLVVRIARGYRRPGVDFDDMVAEGNLGLIRAAEAFDPDMGTRFSTYAAYWVKQSIKRLLVNNAKPIRLPAYMNELMVKWERAGRRLQAELKRTPTHEEIAARLQLDPKKLAIIKQAISIYHATPSTGGVDEGPSLENKLIDGAESPEQAIHVREDVGRILHYVETLDEREASVLRLRFGLDGEEPLTLVAIGERLGLTRERVRQIEKDALQHLSEKMAS